LETDPSLRMKIAALLALLPARTPQFSLVLLVYEVLFGAR
jgi:hypothetical protein